MKTPIALSLIGLLSLASTVAMASESVVEKTKATANDAKRGTKKAAHQVDEAVCTGTEAECAAKKAKHRAAENSEAASDKAEHLKDKVDSDGK